MVQPPHSEDLPGFHKAILDAVPDPVFVFDHDVRIVACNAAALTLLGDNPSGVFHRRGGDALHCIHSTETAKGCGGAPACKDCVIRNSVAQAYEGAETSRRVQKMRLVRGAEPLEVHVLVTTAPIDFDGRRLALLVLEDVTELVSLRKIIPICAGCRKVRDDKQYWQSVELYFKRKLDINFSHGLCPDCVVRLYPDLPAATGDSTGHKVLEE